MEGLRLELGLRVRERSAAVRVARAHGEWVEWQAIVDIARDLNAQVDAEPSPLRRLVLRSAVALTIGQQFGLSEGQVCGRVAVAERVMACTPGVWAAFEAGRLDERRIREISGAVMKLAEPASWARLERLVIDYAEAHTVAQLRTWLLRFVARVESERFNARADDARGDRRVQVTHVEDGMAWINAYVPSFVAAAADRRLDAAAKSAAGDPDDVRTHAQRRADIFSEWLLAADHKPASVAIDIAVTIPVLSLSGSNGEPALSADGHWAIPASWALDPDIDAIPFWHRLLIDPVTDDVLTHEYLGRYPPDVLRRALQFRDPTCRAPGCTKPADRCDIDHRTPWPEGPTTGNNLWALCRKHHTLKGHQILRWTLPDGTTCSAA